MACQLFGAMSVSESMLTYCELDGSKEIILEWYIKIQTFDSGASEFIHNGLVMPYGMVELIGQSWVMACGVFGTMALPEPMPAQYQLYLQEQTLVEFESRHNAFHIENVFENDVCKMSTNLSRIDCVNSVMWCFGLRCTENWRQVLGGCPIFLSHLSVSIQLLCQPLYI